MNIPRLDILLYAHDGRGLGHISRTVAIGMALRRLFPQLRVLVVSGCAQTQDLIHLAPLDWLKLPSYRTEVNNGKSRGIDGNSGFSDRDLGLLRAETLLHTVHQYGPKIVLADHTPQGKHRELTPALASAHAKTQWVLGVRGVVGAVPQAASKLSQDLFSNYFKKLLWYGDSRILGTEQLQQLADRYNTQPVECGYVSRAQELGYLPGQPQTGEKSAGTIAIPWQGEHSDHVLTCIAGALQNIGPEHGDWQLFADLNSDQHRQIMTTFQQLHHCHVASPGPGYMESLRHSKTALIYGGCNSLTDVLAAGLPSVVLLRAMQDSEQQLHLQLLNQSAGGQLLSLEERQVTPDLIESALRRQLQKKAPLSTDINLQGAEDAARHLAAMCR